jgi:hypothetical protein
VPEHANVSGEYAKHEGDSSQRIYQGAISFEIAPSLLSRFESINSLIHPLMRILILYVVHVKPYEWKKSKNKSEE